MSTPPAPLTVDRVLETSRRVGEALQLGYPMAVETLLEEIRLISGALANQLVERDQHGARIAVGAGGASVSWRRPAAARGAV